MPYPATYTIPPGSRIFSSGATDVIKCTQDLLFKKGAFTNLLTDLQDYAILNKVFKNHKKVFKGGFDWKFDVAVASDNTGNGTAKFTGLFENDEFSRKDVLVQGKVSPRFLVASYVFDKREQAMNFLGSRRGEDYGALYDYVKLQMELMYQAAYDKLENALGGSPEYADDKKTPHGLAFYIQKQSNTDATSHPDGDFDGKDPSLKASKTSSTATVCPRCDIKTSEHPRWANWAAQYAAVTKEDLVKKMRLATRKVNFKSPLSLAEPRLSTGRSILTGVDVIMELESILEAQNMSLGNDVAAKDGKVLFKGAPVEYVPTLDGDARKPVYLVDWKTLVFGTVAGWEKKISAPTEDNSAHNTMRGFLDMSVEMACTNLRNQAVLSLKA